MTCGHGDKLGNSVCDFLQWYSKHSIAQLHFGLKHLVHMETPCLINHDFIIVNDSSYMSSWVLHGTCPKTFC